MDTDPRSHGLWEASAPPAPSTSSLGADIASDAVVIGAGFTGLSAALHIAETGRTVSVLEAAEIGFGASGRNVGLVNAGLWAKPSALREVLGDRHGARLLDELGAAPALVFDIIDRYHVDCEAVRNGTLHCAVGAKGLQDITERARQWQALGAPVELLDAKATFRQVGTHRYRGSLLDRRAGTIQPLAYARGLARAALSRGATIHTASPVIATEDLGDRWRIRTAAGSVTATWVIVATNAYSTGIYSMLRAEVVRLPYFNLATKPLDEATRGAILPDRQGIWDTCEVLSSLRLDRAGRLIFGSVGALRGTGRPIHRNWGRRALLQLFPALHSVNFEHAWYGWIGMTDDSLPRFHRVARNTVSINGYNGRGIAPGTAFGRDLARLACGQITEADLSLPATELTSPRFRAAREAFYEVGAQIAHAAGARLPAVGA
ncbi:MAG: FAD-binding oxidoreductase [Steroidobacteraceae bacterium]|jgi:glycine/D-amino acid oxidase-like deaminating enzyme